MADVYAQLESIPEIERVVAFEDKIVLERDAARTKSWHEVADKLVDVFRRALQSVIYKRTTRNPRSVEHMFFP